MADASDNERAQAIVDSFPLVQTYNPVIDTSYITQPHRMGWLRRPELDTETIEAWELPDGKLYAHPAKGHPLMLRVIKRYAHHE